MSLIVPFAGTEAELLEIEEEIDTILREQRARSAAGDETAVDDATLNVAAHRLESLIHDRRTMLAKRPAAFDTLVVAAMA